MAAVAAVELEVYQPSTLASKRNLTTVIELAYSVSRSLRCTTIYCCQGSHCYLPFQHECRLAENSHKKATHLARPRVNEASAWEESPRS